jgi:hypothetical protein
MPEDNRVMTVFSWYRIAMKSVGRKVKFPEGASKERTYLWRQLKTFVKKVDELELDNNTTRELVFELVKYGKQNKLLDRGAAILIRTDLLEVLERKLESDLATEFGLLAEIESSELFLSRQQETKSRIEALLGQKNPGAYANITCWHQSGRLARSFIALSKSCCQALSKLDNDERKELPPDTTLLKLRILCLQDQHRARKIYDLMGLDLHRRS